MILQFRTQPGKQFLFQALPVESITPMELFHKVIAAGREEGGAWEQKGLSAPPPSDSF